MSTRANINTCYGTIVLNYLTFKIELLNFNYFQFTTD